MKAVVIGALAATAYSADPLTYTGTYTATGPATAVTGCCIPNTDVTITKTGTQVGVAWTFGGAATTPEACADTDWQGDSVTATGTPKTTPAAEIGDVAFTTAVNAAGESWVLDAPLAANGEFSLNLEEIVTGCIATLTKKPPTTVTYPGVYEVTSKLGTTASCCYPAGDVIVRRALATDPVSLEWTFDNTASCAVADAKGQSVDQSGTPDATTKNVQITEVLNGNNYDFVLDAAPLAEGDFLLNLGSLSTDCSVTLKRRSLPELTYPRVYEVTSAGDDATCCYPAGDVTVTQDNAKKVTVAWTFGEEAGCGTTYKGQVISGGSVPDTVTGDVEFTTSLNSGTQTWVLDAPITATGDWKLDLSQVATGCSATLERKSGYLVGLGSLVALSLSYLMF